MKRLLFLAAAALVGCSASLDPITVPCRNDGECPTGAYCAAGGKCTPSPSCNGGLSPCHDTCVDLKTSAANCGSCGNACPATASGTASCSAGSCGFTCTPPAVPQGSGCLAPPAQPTGLTATAHATVALHWAAQADATSYELLRATAAAGPFTSLASPSTNSYTDVSALAGTTYFYEVEAHNAAGASAATAAVSALTQPASPTHPGVALVTGGAMIEVQWDRMPGAASYDVYRGAAAATVAFYQNVPDPGTGASATFNDAATPAGTVTFYAVLAKNASGSSATAAAGSELTVPAAPTTVMAALQSDNSVTVTWSASTGATGYAVFRSGTQLATVAATISSYNDAPGPGTSAAYTVAAIDATGTGPQSGPQDALTRPDVPAHVVASLDVSQTTITVTWDRMAGATSYLVYRTTTMGAESSATPVQVNDPGMGSSATFSDTAPDSGQTDYYKVLATNASGSSGFSLETNATTLPPAPSAVGATLDTADNGITVTWTAPAGSTGIYVYRADVGATPIAGPLTATPGTPATYTDSPAAGGSYQYSVAAKNSTGIGPQSSPTASVLTRPPAVTLATGALSASGSTTTINLSWSSANGATGYDVYKDGVKQTSVATTATVDTESVRATAFTFKVIATNTAGASPDSNTVSVTTVANDPTNLATSGLGTSTVTATWNRSTGATSYDLKRGPAGAETHLAFVSDPVSGATASYVDNGLSPSTSYSYVVAALNNGGALSSANSNEVSVTTPTPVPTGLTATPADDTHVSLSWTRIATGVDSYDVLCGTSTGGESATPVANVPNPGSGTTVAFSVSKCPANLTSNTAYFFQVVGRSGALKSAPSAEANARTMLPMPTGLTVGNLTDTSIDVTWTKPAGGPYQYRLLHGLGAGQEAQAGVVNDTGTGATQVFTDGALVPGTAYFFKVQTFNAAGNTSLPSAEVTGSTTNLNGVPFVLFPVDPTHVQVHIFRLTGYDNYDLFASQTAAPTAASTPTAGPFFHPDGSDFFVVDTLPVTGTWNYYARAHFGGGTPTPWSAAQTITTTSTPPAAPSSLVVVAAGNNQVLLQWDGMQNATSYNISRGTTPSGPFTSITQTANPYFADVGSATTDPKNGRTYYYQVQSMGTGGIPGGTSNSPAAAVDPSAFAALERLIYYTSTGATSVPPQFTGGKVLTPGPTGSTFGFACLVDGHCLTTQPLPAGPVWVKSGPHHFLTSLRSMDLSKDLVGRADQQFYNTITPISFTLSNLSSWAVTDALQFISTNLALNGEDDLEQAPLAGPPQPGDTGLTGFQVDATTWGAQVDTSKGDKPYVLQRALFTSSNGVSYSTVVRSLTGFGMSQADGRVLAVSGAFSNVAPTTTPFKYLRSQFKALASGINPNAVPNGAPDSITFTASTYDSSGIRHPFTTGGSNNSATLLTFLLDSGTTDVDAGTIGYGNPLPTTGAGGFGTFISLSGGFNVSVDCNTCAAGGTALQPFPTSGDVTTIDDLGTVLAQAAGAGIAPQLFPIQKPQITRSTGGPALDLFADQTAVGATPTISWTAPTSTVQPTFYRLFLTKIGDDGSGSGVANQLDQIQLYALPAATGPNSITLPSGLKLNSGTGPFMTPGGTYYVMIRATYEPERDLANRPFIRGQREYFVDTVSNSFTF